MSSWRTSAACSGVDIAVFFEPEDKDTALKYCADCLVVSECRSAGDTAEQADTILCGILGGETPRQRLRRRRAARRRAARRDLPQRAEQA